jgi:predicted lipoprotein with Yx(FWY)xxD motif
MERDMNTVKTMRAKAAGGAGLVAAALLIAACGSSASTGGSGSAGSGSAGSTSAGTNAASAKPATAGGGAATIATAKGTAGTFLVGQGGRAVYLWVADKGMKSTCSGGCAQTWPPVLTKGAPKAAGGVKSSLLGTTKRSDGTTEVTYKGHPLYYFAGDSSAGSITGQGSTSFGAPWWLVSTSGAAITTH